MLVTSRTMQTKSWLEKSYRAKRSGALFCIVVAGFGGWLATVDFMNDLSCRVL